MGKDLTYMLDPKGSGWGLCGKHSAIYVFRERLQEITRSTIVRLNVVNFPLQWENL